MKLKWFAISSFLSVTLLLVSAHMSFAKADDLIILDDGRVILLITNNVLAETTTKGKAPPAAPPPAPAKTVPLTPAHTQSEVKINPPINNDKKIQVTITTPTKQSNIASPQPATVINKAVDQVVAKGAAGQTVFSIKSEKANQLIIKQEDIQVKTPLPLQIDTVSHALSIPSSNGSAGSDKIQVLPKEAVQGILNKGILENKNINDAKISLTKDSSGVNYTVQSEKNGKLFGFIPVKAPTEVTLSAQTGKVVITPRSVIFNFVGKLIK